MRHVDIDVTLNLGSSVSGSRFPLPIQASVYLCCAAAVRDAEETAAKEVAIRIECHNGEVRFTAVHDTA